MSTPAASVVEAAPQSGNELFALTDEQILDIQPETEESASVAQALLPVRDVSPTDDRSSQAGAPVPPEPPPWLARQMNDPWSGDDARDLWNGVQQARGEAAAYREVFAKPEEARAAADRARALEEIDSAFFGGAGKSAQEVSASRTALAQRMLREDPAAFREMVFAGLRALESAAHDPNVPPSATSPLPIADRRGPDASHQSLPGNHQSPVTSRESQLAAYRSFEKSANEELERSVGNTIQHSLEQALPALPRGDRSSDVAARLQQSVRDQVEIALKSDQQLGDQLSRVLSARRFDETTRSQVVRLINDRAQQLVPVAARRVLQDWTQTAFAAHRGKAVSNSRDVVPGFSPASGEDAVLAGKANAAQPRSLAVSSSPHRGASTRASAPAASARAAAADRAERDAGLTPRVTARPNGRAVDYARLTDEQILDL